MALVHYNLDLGTELTLEERARIKGEIERASSLPYVEDPDCPLLTEAELAEFRPVNFSSMEERTKAMRVKQCLAEKKLMAAGCFAQRHKEKKTAKVTKELKAQFAV